MSCSLPVLNLLSVFIAFHSALLVQAIPRAAIHECIDGYYFGPREVSAPVVSCLAKLGLTPENAASLLQRKREDVAFPVEKKSSRNKKRNEIPIAATNFPTATGSAAVPDPTIVEAYEQDATVLAPDFQVLGKAYPVAVLCKNAYPEPNIKASKFKPQIPAACKVAGDSYASKIKALPATADIPKPTATNLEMMSDIITGTVDNVPYKFWMGASMAYTGSDVAEWATSHCTNALNLMTTNIKDVKDDFPSRCVWTDSPPESPLSMTEDAPPPESTGGHQRREATPDGVLLGGDVYAITDLDTEHLILHVGFEAGGDNAKTSAIKLREGPYDIYMDHVMNPGLTYTTIDATGKILDHKPGADPKLPDVADNEVPLGRTAEAGAGPGGNVYGDEDNPKDPPPAPPNPGENPTGDDDDDVCDGDYDDEEGGTAPPPQATGSSKYFLY